MSKAKDEKSNVIYEDGFFMGKNEIKIFYRSFEVDNSKSVIVISHGFCESSDKYREFIKLLNKILKLQLLVLPSMLIILLLIFLLIISFYPLFISPLYS